MSNTKHTPSAEAGPCYVWVEVQPQYWHQWGNEPEGTVSTFAYDSNDDYHFTGYKSKEEVKELNLKFLSPFS